MSISNISKDLHYCGGTKSLSCGLFQLFQILMILEITYLPNFGMLYGIMQDKWNNSIYRNNPITYKDTPFEYVYS